VGRRRSADWDLVEFRPGTAAAWDFRRYRTIQPLWMPGSHADFRGLETEVTGPSGIVQVAQYSAIGEMYSQSCTFSEGGEGACVAVISKTASGVRTITETMSVHASVATITYTPAKNAAGRSMNGLREVLGWSIACGLLAAAM
jgi:hypothetical protein